jgi:hypothetical protein
VGVPRGHGARARRRIVRQSRRRPADEAVHDVLQRGDRARAERAAPKSATASDGRTGVAYLAQKKARRDAARELAERAQETVADLYDRLSARAREATRRTASELPAQGGSLLLDAAFLIPRRRAASFKTLAGREAKALARHGYGVTLTGPWPPYSFVQD